MTKLHKNKTLTTLLAFTLGGLGLHRFYLYGTPDRWAWVHFSSLPLSGLAMRIWPEAPLMFSLSPLIISVLSSFIEALVVGLTPDDKWDAIHNHNSGKQSDSHWPLVLLLVLITGVGAVALIGVIARWLDLLFTGVSYG